jgi:hypothetical protein
MITNILKVKADISFVPVYTCSHEGCNAMATGTTMRFELSSLSPVAIQDAINCKYASSIPIGWAVYGVGVVKCPKHVT